MLLGEDGTLSDCIESCMAQLYLVLYSLSHMCATLRKELLGRKLLRSKYYRCRSVVKTVLLSSEFENYTLGVTTKVPFLLINPLKVKGLSAVDLGHGGIFPSAGTICIVLKVLGQLHRKEVPHQESLKKGYPPIKCLILG